MDNSEILKSFEPKKELNPKVWDLNSGVPAMKSEVRELAKYLGVSKEIYDAVPTDGLWGDNRSDEQQIGASYDELEWAMKTFENGIYRTTEAQELNKFTTRQAEVMKIYIQRHENGKHKMNMPPICEISNEGKNGEKLSPCDTLGCNVMRTKAEGGDDVYSL
jgi:NH3-dependent NAD+ synthetase